MQNRTLDEQRLLQATSGFRAPVHEPDSVRRNYAAAGIRHGVRAAEEALGLRDYSGKLIPSLGTFEAEIEYSGTRATVTYYVTQKGSSLLGLDAIQKLQINIVGSSLTCLHTTHPFELLENTPPGFEALFSEGLGFVKDYVHQIKRRPDVAPVSAKLRRLPLALRQQAV
ncbi:hypothetical protein MTO96_052002 [Rhipicephalus appendiculatus]